MTEHNPNNKECEKSKHCVPANQINCIVGCTCPTNQETPEHNPENRECEATKIYESGETSSVAVIANHCTCTPTATPVEELHEGWNGDTQNLPTPEQVCPYGTHFDERCQCKGVDIVETVNPPEQKDFVEGKWEEEFDKKLKELNDDNNPYNEEGCTDTFEFGYKAEAEEKNCISIWTVPDWGNIKKFIRKVEAQAYTQGEQAGMEKLLSDYWTGVEDLDIHKAGFLAGVERAKEAMPEAHRMDIEYLVNYATGRNNYRTEALSALQELTTKI